MKHKHLPEFVGQPIAADPYELVPYGWIVNRVGRDGKRTQLGVTQFVGEGKFRVYRSHPRQYFAGEVHYYDSPTEACRSVDAEYRKHQRRERKFAKAGEARS